MTDEGSRYPLEAARKVRGRAVGEAEAVLASAVADLAAADAVVADAREELRAHTAALRREALALAAREDLGGSAAELSRGQAFRARRKSEQAALCEAVRAAEVARDEAAEALGAARTQLAEAQGEKEVVERHHERFRSAERRVRATREEAEAEDLAAARRHRSDP